MEAILFPTIHNDELETGLASHWLVDGRFYPTVHNRCDPYALPAFELEGQWIYPSEYNQYMEPELPALVLRGNLLFAAHDHYPLYGMPMFTMLCLCPEHLPQDLGVALPEGWPPAG